MVSFQKPTCLVDHSDLYRYVWNTLRRAWIHIREYTSRTPIFRDASENRKSLIRRDRDNDSHGGVRESRGGRTFEDRDLRRHPAVHRRGWPLPMVPFHRVAALHLRLRVPLLHAVLHHATASWALVHRARARQLEPHGRTEVSEISFTKHRNNRSCLFGKYSTPLYI